MPMHTHNVHASIAAEATTPARTSKGDFEAMAKRRFQDPQPEKVGAWWYLRYRRDEFADGKLIRRLVRHRLAPADTREREVLKLAAEFLRPLNQGLTPVSSAMTFADYVTTAYNADF